MINSKSSNDSEGLRLAPNLAIFVTATKRLPEFSGYRGHRYPGQPPPRKPVILPYKLQIFFPSHKLFFSGAGCIYPLGLPRSGGTSGPSDHLSSTLANRDLGRPRKSGSSLTWWTHENRNYLEKSTMIYLLLSLSVLNHVIVHFLAAKAAQ